MTLNRLCIVLVTLIVFGIVALDEWGQHADHWMQQTRIWGTYALCLIMFHCSSIYAEYSGRYTCAHTDSAFVITPAPVIKWRGGIGFD